MTEKFKLRDVVMMKKPHACGANTWTIIRVGADIKVKCNGCGLIVMMDRAEFVRSCKQVIEYAKKNRDLETVTDNLKKPAKQGAAFNLADKKDIKNLSRMTVREICAALNIAFVKNKIRQYASFFIYPNSVKVELPDFYTYEMAERLIYQERELLNQIVNAKPVFLEPKMIVTTFFDNNLYVIMNLANYKAAFLGYKITTSDNNSLRYETYIDLSNDLRAWVENDTIIRIGAVKEIVSRITDDDYQKIIHRIQIYPRGKNRKINLINKPIIIRRLQLNFSKEEKDAICEYLDTKEKIKKLRNSPYRDLKIIAKEFEHSHGIKEGNYFKLMNGGRVSPK